jgi:hypothetical protein
MGAIGPNRGIIGHIGGNRKKTGGNRPNREPKAQIGGQ